MAEKNRQANKTTPSTQKYLDIAEIRDDIVIMKDGTLRSTLLVSSVNFALKAEDEQRALISSYMDFINSFDFPFQIVIQSRKLNMEKYIQSIAELEKEQQNELLKEQMRSYREYVKELIEIGDIMTKRFYVVIMYSPYSQKQKGFFTKIREVFTPGKIVRISRKNFEQYSRELEIRADQVVGQLGSMGLQAVRLDTQSLIELYYNIYNPTTSGNQPLEDINQLRAETTF